MLRTINITRDENGVAISIEGRPAEILTDLTIITRNVYQGFLRSGTPEPMAKEFVKSAIGTAVMSEAELKAKTIESLKELLDKIENSDDEEEDELSRFARIHREIEEEVVDLETEDDSEER